MRGILGDTVRELLHRKTIWAFVVVILLSLLAVYLTQNIEAKFGVGDAQGADIGALNEQLGNPLLFGFDRLMSVLIFMAVLASAGLLPRMFEKGRAEYYLSKPLSRTGLLVRKMASIWFIYGGTAVLSGLIISLWVGLFHGVWSGSIELLILLSFLSFLIWLSVLFLFGLLSQSTGMGITVVFLIWVLEKLLQRREMFKNLVDSTMANILVDGLYYVIPKPGGVSDIFMSIADGKHVTDWMPLWSTGIVCVVILYLAAFVFRQRDY